MNNDAILVTRAAPSRRQDVRAIRIGGRLTMDGLEEEFADVETLENSSLVVRLKSGGYAALFSYGTVVFVSASESEQQSLLTRLEKRIEDQLDAATVVETKLEYGASTKLTGNSLTINHDAPSSVLVVADALAKNVAIAFEEAEVKKLLVALEPFAGDLADTGRLPLNRRRMLRTVGQVFRIHRRLLERIDVEEKPDSLSQHGESAKLWERLAQAYHLRKRARSVSNKLDAIEVMMNGLTELINAQREVRIELLIVFLIAVEIAIWVYESFIQA